jgi:hypothetical protein
MASELSSYSTSGTSLDPAVIEKATWAARGALIRARLLLPYLANFLNETEILQSEKVGPTFAVSPNLILVYNPLFVLGMNEEGAGMSQWEYGLAFLHESLHIVLNHFSRWEVYKLQKHIEQTMHNQMKWNRAADCEINVMLRKIHPINPIYEGIANSIFTDNGMMDKYRWNSLSNKQRGETVRRLAKQEWEALPYEDRYPGTLADDWPHEGVTMPPWFCFPETTLKPPQGPRGTAEDYYPFVPDRSIDPATDQNGQQESEWEGYKIGDRVVDKTTGEEGEVVAATPYNANNDPPQDITVVVTNHWTEGSRSRHDAEEIGVVIRAKQDAGITADDEKEIAKEVRAANRERVKTQSAKGFDVQEFTKRLTGKRRRRRGRRRRGESPDDVGIGV